MLTNNITAVILAAGQGTRMKSSRPKVLHEILGRPMIAYLLDTLREAGVNDIVVVVGHQAEAVKEALKDYGVRFVIQEPQLGTGHAVQVAMPAVPPEAGDRHGPVRRRAADFRGKYRGAATAACRHRGRGHRPDHRVAGRGPLRPGGAGRSRARWRRWSRPRIPTTGPTSWPSGRSTPGPIVLTPRFWLMA